METQNLGRVKMVWKGAYSSATAYKKDDAVSYEGSSYICIQDATNKVPTNTSYWDVLAEKGQDGADLTERVTTIESKIPSNASSSNKMATASDVASRVDWPSYAKTGVHNFAVFNKLEGTSGSLLNELTSTGIRVYISTDAAYQRLYATMNLPKNTNMSMSSDVTYVAGIARLGIQGYKNGTWTDIFFSPEKTESGKISFDFNTGDYDSWKVWLYCTGATAVAGDVTYDNFLIKLATDTNTTYAPYAMTNRELTNAIFAKTPMLDNTVDLNDLKTTGIYGFSSTPINAPAGETYGTIIVQKSEGNDSVRQILYTAYGSSSAIFVRAFRGATPAWTSWYKFTGTAV